VGGVCRRLSGRACGDRPGHPWRRHRRQRDRQRSDGGSLDVHGTVHRSVHRTVDDRRVRGTVHRTVDDRTVDDRRVRGTVHRTVDDRRVDDCSADDCATEHHPSWGRTCGRSITGTGDG